MSDSVLLFKYNVPLPFHMTNNYIKNDPTVLRKVRRAILGVCVSLLRQIQLLVYLMSSVKYQLFARFYACAIQLCIVLMLIITLSVLLNITTISFLPSHIFRLIFFADHNTITAIILVAPPCIRKSRLVLLHCILIFLCLFASYQCCYAQPGESRYIIFYSLLIYTRN